MTIRSNINHSIYPYDLKCDSYTNPMGINSCIPVLSWKIKDCSIGSIQTAYQILVSSSRSTLEENIADFWDSGKIDSDQSQQVEYHGTPLQSKIRVYWKVRVWTPNDVSEYSEINWWEMGLLQENDWDAQWIAAPEIPKSAEEIRGMWIWQYGMHTVFIRKVFCIKTGVIQKAVIKIEVDNDYRLYINGIKVQVNKCISDERQSIVYDITSLVKNGENLIAIRATQTTCPEWVMSAVRADVEIRYLDSEIETISTDETWRIAHIDWDRSVKVIDSENWYMPEYKNDYWRQPEICHVSHPRTIMRSHYFRREFKLGDVPVYARIYITAHGLYELYINGQRVGHDLFTPGITESEPEKNWYSMHMSKHPYQIYDISSFLVEGQNVIGVLSGGGFWNGWAHSFLMSLKPELLLQMHVSLENGVTFELASDEEFMVMPSPIIEDSIMFGERYDARLEICDWNQNALDPILWKRAEIVLTTKKHIPFFANCVETVQEAGVLEAATMTKLDNDKYIYDYGTNEVGRCILKIENAKRGDQIMIRYAEWLNEDGTLNDGNYRDVMGCNHEAPYATKNMDLYICRGGPLEYFEPRFTYTGFQFIEISGYPGVPGLDTVKCRIIHTNLNLCGTFNCSNDLVNTIWSNTRRSIAGNMFEVPTDCPTREKMPWTGDAQNIAQTAGWYLNIANFFKRFTTNGPKLELNAVGWGDEEIIIPWRLYCFYNDKQVLIDNYPKAVSLIEKRLSVSKNYLYKGQSFEWGDHGALEKTAGGVMAAAYFYYNVTLTAEIAKTLGYLQNFERFTALAEKIIPEFNKEYMNEDYTYGTGTQASSVFALFFGLVPERYKSRVVDALAEKIKVNGYHLSTGFSATEFLLPVLSENGKHEDAYTLVNQTTYPSWGYSISLGATSIWEYWTKVGSANHYALGNVSRWFFEYLAGLRYIPDFPGFKRFVLNPIIPAALDSVRMTYESIYGQIESSWIKNGNRIDWTVEIPPNTTAEIRFPFQKSDNVTIDGIELSMCNYLHSISNMQNQTVYELGAGKYQFSITDLGV